MGINKISPWGHYLGMFPYAWPVSTNHLFQNLPSCTYTHTREHQTHTLQVTKSHKHLPVYLALICFIQNDKGGTGAISGKHVEGSVC